MDFSYLVVVKQIVTAVIIIFEFPCLIELEKEESCVYYPCIREDHKKNKRGDWRTAPLPPATEARGCYLLRVILSFRRAQPPGRSQHGLQDRLALLTSFIPPLSGGWQAAERRHLEAESPETHSAPSIQSRASLKEDTNQTFGQVSFVCHGQCLQQKDMSLCMFSVISCCMISCLY